MTRNVKPRHLQRTVLIVGEGNSEVLLLNHIKSLYVQRGQGVAITIKNANGKGAGHVVDYTARASRNAAYDVRVALFDTDTDWNEAVRKRAKQLKVQILPCEPCLEAVLLDIHQYAISGQTTMQLKRRFLEKFGAVASDKSVLKHFTLEALELAKLRIPAIDALIHLMKNAEFVKNA